MKNLANLGIVIAGLSLIAALYLQFSVIPKKDMSQMVLFSDNPESFYNSPEHTMHLENLNYGTDFAIYVMFAGILAFILCIIPAIKRIKIAWLGVIMALASTLIGILHGTHMFS